MRRDHAMMAATAMTLVLAGLPLDPVALAQQAKKGEMKKGEAKKAEEVVESIDPRGEPKSAAIKAIAGPKVCLGYKEKEGEWTVVLRPGDADWTPIDGWIELDGGELTKVTGFANLETNLAGNRSKHIDKGKYTKRRIDFDLWVKSGGTDSFRFIPSEETRSIRFRFRIGEKLAASERILIGKDAKHPAQGEFSLKARP